MDEKAKYVYVQEHIKEMLFREAERLQGHAVNLKKLACELGNLSLESSQILYHLLWERGVK